MGLESVELLLSVEEEFEITLSDKDVVKVYTVQDLHALVLRTLIVVENEHDIYNRLVQLISKQMAIPASKTTPQSDLIKDLGFD